ncbi:hypothetical protein LY78DRAFT_12670 [Colletotrichum sublineola]|nr:hypothetical protein LY78DRAFT_12670 [Colletotrichum sublineola]
MHLILSITSVHPAIGQQRPASHSLFRHVAGPAAKRETAEPGRRAPIGQRGLINRILEERLVAFSKKLWVVSVSVASTTLESRPLPRYSPPCVIAKGRGGGVCSAARMESCIHY